VNDKRLVDLGQLFAALLAHLALDLADDSLGLLGATVDEEPARALRHVAAHDQDPDAERRPDPKGEAPAEVRGEEGGVEQEDRSEGAGGRAEPVAAVDHQVHPAADPGRNQLVDRRVDRRVLAADPRAGEEARRVEVPGGEGEGGGHGGDDVEGKRDQEQLLAPEAVGQLAEEERAEAGAADVEGGRGADLAGVERDAAAVFGQPLADAADNRDLESVEDPDGPEPDHHHPVKARPGQPVEAGRDVGLDRLPVLRGVSPRGLHAHPYSQEGE